MLFQLIETRIVLDIIGLSLLIIAYLFIVIAGALNLKKEEKLQGSIFFIIIGAIEIVYGLLKGRLSSLVYTFMGFTPLTMNINHIIMYIMPNIISMITFGILIIILGKKNSERFGKNLLLSGIFWIVYSVILLIVNIIMFPASLFPLTPTLVLIFEIIAIIIIPLMVVSRIFLLLYALKIRVKCLTISSIILIIASAVFFIYWIITLLMILVP